MNYAAAYIRSKVKLILPVILLSLIILYKNYGPTIEFFASAFLMSILIIASFLDIERGIIPNCLSFTAIIGGCIIAVYNLFRPFGFYGDRCWWNPVLGIVLCPVLLLIMSIICKYLFGINNAIGMGDIKIFIPIGMILGWRLSLTLLMLTILFGGVLSIFRILSKKNRIRKSIPLAPLIATATLVLLITFVG